MVITPKNDRVSNVDMHLIVPLMSREVLCAKQQQIRHVNAVKHALAHKLNRSRFLLLHVYHFSGLRYHCQFHTLKTAIQISLTSGWDWVWVFLMTLPKKIRHLGFIQMLGMYWFDKIYLRKDVSGQQWNFWSKLGTYSTNYPGWRQTLEYGA